MRYIPQATNSLFDIDYSLDNSYSWSSLKEISISDESKNFSSENGVWFDKDKTVLVKYPCAKVDTEYRIPNTVKEVRGGALRDVIHSFKVPLGKILPLIGILGTTYMILNISTDSAERLAIWGVTGIAFLILGIYSFFWIKYKMRMPVFKSVPMEEVMAMENDLYYVIRKEKGIWR